MVLFIDVKNTENLLLDLRSKVLLATTLSRCHDECRMSSHAHSDFPTWNPDGSLGNSDFLLLRGQTLESKSLNQ